ncbi:SprT family zinc-dependent metalloprotease [Alisedimentitalea sp. MJ-SS2]|uniref:M48 family metallopeptidase n=1 Tax=Aliisedimentitalea sp. MJ-SS2 TaxID=3049795 RepID=UPI00291171FE|nr:SprT family zinc-dependent metalloprotease [Alisedimentitalea sp. MJ-SS2]MDU8927843.1 SprT family zinc-dependent metalloprotease [Alisedimentitalea sp. MJ-SS2]
MTRHVLPGDPPVELVLRRSARARRISLRVSGADGRVTLTMPKGASEREALEFAAEKADWLRGHLDKRPDEVSVGIGAELPFRGSVLRVMPGTGRAVVLREGEIAVPGKPERVAARLQGFVKETARARLAEASDRYAAALGRDYSRITLRDTRSRWGSCSAHGGLMYSWRLILAPDEVLDYVAAHEVAHLVEMNHSSRFWGHVEDLYGDYAAPRKWLRMNGAGLHRYRF